jgi:hypothetical protein
LPIKQEEENNPAARGGGSWRLPVQDHPAGRGDGRSGRASSLRPRRSALSSENCHVGKIVADDGTISAISEGVRAYALDPVAAEALWRKSEELVEESF